MDNYVQLNSVTQAMHAQKLLRAKGIKSKVIRISAARGRGSCSYGLKIFNRFDEAITLLRENGIKPEGRAFGGRL